MKENVFKVVDAGPSWSTTMFAVVKNPGSAKEDVHCSYLNFYQRIKAPDALVEKALKKSKFKQKKDPPIQKTLQTDQNCLPVA